jgi:type IV secretion system protein VirB9
MQNFNITSLLSAVDQIGQTYVSTAYQALASAATSGGGTGVAGLMLTRPPSGQLYEVRFRFPGDEADAKLVSLAKERAANPNLKDLNITNANSDYGYKGSSANNPVAVFDDGTKTWFRFEGENPAIYIVDAERNESLVNFRTEGPYVVVDKVSRQWTLRNGAESTCIFNRRLTNVHEPDGLEPYGPQRIGQPSSSSAGG